MTGLKIFLKSTDYLASKRLFMLSALVSPALQILFVSTLIKGNIILGWLQNSLPVASITVSSFAITIFVSSVCSDRLNRIYSTQLIGNGFTKFMMKRSLYVWLASIFMAVLVWVILAASNLFAVHLKHGMHSFSAPSLTQTAWILGITATTGTGIGLFFSCLGLYFKDPYKLVNLIVPFLPVLMPILTVRHNLPAVLYYLSWIFPGNFTIAAFRSGTSLASSFQYDLILTAIYLVISLSIGKIYLHHLVKTGKSEQPY